MAANKGGALLNLDWRLVRNIDWVLVLAVLVLCATGVAVVSSAARGYDPQHWQVFVIKQAAGVVLGLVAMVAMMAVDYTEFPRLYRFLYYANLVLLALVFVPGLGVEHNGARSWIQLRVVEAQPAELSKLLLVLTLGWRLVQMEHVDSWWGMAAAGAHLLPALALILKQPDLGTALVILAMAAAALYMAGVAGWRFLVLGGLLAALVAGVVVANVRYGVHVPGVSQYQIKRILCWINPEFEPEGACYNVYQSKVAVGSGGLRGRGLYQGPQTQLSFVPENITDFIFSVVGEELGFVGSAAVLLLFLVVLWRILGAAMQAKDTYGALICAGAFGVLGFHVVENVGMAMGVMPVTGIPLPFISYGPTAVVANLALVGLVLNVYMRRHPIQF